MILNFSELRQIVDEINSEIFENEVSTAPKIQKIYSSGRIVLLQLRLRGRNLCISLGRGGEYCGLWTNIKTIPSEYRIVRDRFLEFLRSNIRNSRLEKIVLDDKDKILSFNFIDKSRLLLFWRGRSLYFSYIYHDKDVVKHYSPWFSQKRELFEYSSDFELFESAGRKQLDSNKSVREVLKLDEGKLFDKKPESIKNKKLEKKRFLIQKDLDNCKVRHELQVLLDSNTIDLDTQKYSFKSFRIKFKHGLNHYQKRDLIYTKIKKLKVGEVFLTKRLKEVEDELERKKVNFIDQKIHTPIWKSSIAKDKVVKTNDNHLILSWNDIHIAIGLNTTGNDYIRSKWSKKGDIWFHLDGYKSAHVIAKGMGSFEFDSYQVVASILADHSDFIGDQIPTIFTAVENLKGVKGSSGKVTFKKEKHLVFEKVNWKEIISSSW